VFVAALALGFLLHRSLPLPIVPAAGRLVIAIVGWVLVALWAILFFPALLLFHRARTGVMPHHPATTIVERGPYRWTRNPMYVGMTILSAGVACVFNVLWALLLLPLAVLIIDRYIVAREERYLERTFGDAYRAYQLRVRRWL
jgi:protein-S-isoprenylcysteine O-methyltransferase Ste14